MAYTTDVDDVCTEAELDEELGGGLIRKLGLKPSGWSDCRPARQWALNRFLDHLARLPNPVLESHLTDPTQLKFGVLCGASERLFHLAITSGNTSEVFVFQMQTYAKKFTNEMENFRPTVSVGGDCSGRAVSRGIRIVRG